MDEIIEESESLKKRSPEKEAKVTLQCSDREDGRREKSWQRVPCVYFFLILGMYLVLGHLTQMIEDSMPNPKFDEDLPIDESELDIFSEESGWYYLTRIIGEKPRVAGTSYHLEKTKDLKKILDTIASDVILPVKTDWQLASGDFSVNTTMVSINSYHKVSNLMALLVGESGEKGNKSIGSTIIVNCHYDSVPSSPGASDNGIFCACMVVILQKLSRKSHKLKHNIVFLFNGAEENPLQGSHAFLQHPWSRNIIAVVNLDAAGMNGKANLFQVTDPRVLKAYQRTCSRPSAQSIGELIFASGLVPSGTDFRIWHDYGNIYGVDLAFIKWGHVYHTFNDHPKWIQKGVIQEAGDMLLGLLKEIADDPVLTNPILPSPMVYYDYLNMFLLVYSVEMAHLVDSLIVVVAIMSVCYYISFVGFRRSTFYELLYSVGGRILSSVVGILTVAVLIPFVSTGNLQLRYLSHPWLVVAMYWVPYVLAAVTSAHLYDVWRTKKSGLNRLTRVLQAMAATRLILAAFILMLLCIPGLAQMRYVFSVPLLVSSIASFITVTLNKYVRLTAWQHLLLEIILSIPTVLFLFSLSLRVNALMLPIMGRNSTDRPDVIVAILNLALVVLVATTVSGIELLFSRRRLWLILSSLSALCLIAMFKTMDPYVSPTTQRHVWFHTEIKSISFNNEVENNRSGVFIFKWDAYTVSEAKQAFERYGYQYKMDTNLSWACEEFVYCDMPLFRPVMGNFIKDSMFIYATPPRPFSPPASLRLVNATCFEDICIHSYTMDGAPHNIITVWPVKEVELEDWTFASFVRPAFVQKQRPVYVISHSVSTYSETVEPFHFTLTFRVPVQQQGGPIVHISHHAHKVQHPEEATSDFLWIQQAAPEYFSLIPFISFRTNYVF